MQPSLLLALLAISNLMTGNELEKGHAGRIRACKFIAYVTLIRWATLDAGYIPIVRLRDAAQALLDASMNASWIEPTLAQAAWVCSSILTTPTAQ
jgi:hypothetical protein